MYFLNKHFIDEKQEMTIWYILSNFTVMTWILQFEKIFIFAEVRMLKVKKKYKIDVSRHVRSGMDFQKDTSALFITRISGALCAPSF